MKSLKLLTATMLLAPSAWAQTTLRVQPGSLELEWLARFPSDTGTPALLGFQWETSEDLQQWQAVGNERWISREEGQAPLSTKVQRAANARTFYRLRETTKFARSSALDPAAEPNYQAQFEHFLNKGGEISVEEFAKQFGQAKGKEGISWDLRAAEFWKDFATSPAEHNAKLPANSPERRLFDFRLNEPEQAAMQKLGFVVSERLASRSFVDLYYRLWIDDLPVFISTDSVLHAWHKTYLAMLAEIEQFYLQPELDAMLRALRAEFPKVWQTQSSGPLRESLADLDFFLTVAASLSQESTLAPHIPENARLVNYWLPLLRRAEGFELVEGLFGQPGKERITDLSQFQPRGQYTSSLGLSAYFRAMMWLGRTSFWMGGGSREAPGSLRQLAGAAGMSLLLEQADQVSRWKSMEQIIATFVGQIDSMTPEQMLLLLKREGLESWNALASSGATERLQKRILAGPYGRQEIFSDTIEPGLESEAAIVLPRAFTLMGQRFLPDSWVLSQVVFDRIRHEGSLVKRRYPSCLDVAFAALGNDQSVPLLAERMRSANGRYLRDGLPYQQNLAAARRTLDAQVDEFWTENIYQAWLHALRALSPAAVQTRYPEVMRTDAWGRKAMTTQLASWTELRHDTVLYAKQSTTPGVLCEYPAGYVEPRLEFWERMESLAKMTRERIALLNISGQQTITQMQAAGIASPPQLREIMVDRASRSKTMLDSLAVFAQTMRQLRDISEAELSGQPLTEAQVSFLKGTVQSTGEVYAGSRSYTGWYPKLYFSSILFNHGNLHPSELWDALIADVHTTMPDDRTGDRGGITYQAVGNVNLLYLGVEHGDKRCLFAGPVFSHYEFTGDPNKRLSDENWKASILEGKLPPISEWSADYLVPATGAQPFFAPPD